MMEKAFSFFPHCATFFRFNFHLVKGPFHFDRCFRSEKKAFDKFKAPLSAPLEFCSKKKFFENIFFQVREKRFSSFMRIPSGILRHYKFDRFLAKESLAY